MAQPQAQGRDVSATNTPAVQSRRGQLAARDLSTWAAGPFGLMRRLSDDLDLLFGELISGGDTGRGAFASAPGLLPQAVDWVPAMEVSERDNELVVQADLPGCSADDLRVEVIDGFLTVSGERREEREIEDDGFRRTERRYGRFSRVIALPEGARTDDIQASYRDGVLAIRVPLERQASRRRAIDVQTAQSGQSAQSASREGSSAGAGRTGASRERGDGGSAKEGSPSGRDRAGANSAGSASPGG